MFVVVIVAVGALAIFAAATCPAPLRVPRGAAIVAMGILDRLDYASASIIGTACTVLFCRIIVAIQKNQAIKDALQQHHKQRPSRLSQYWERTCTAAAKLPPSARIGLAGVACSIVPWLLPAAFQLEGRMGNVAGMAGKCKPWRTQTHRHALHYI